MATVGCGAGPLASNSGITKIATPSVASTYYSNYSQFYKVPFVGSPDFSNLTSTLKVHAQANGGTVSSFTVDTGSVGMILPASEIPNLPAGTAGSITYSSSGLKLTGTWSTVTVSFPDSTNESGSSVAATATIPVLAVTSGTCLGTGVNSANCTGAIPHMLGIGFGRGTTLTTSPPYNAALNLTEMVAGTMRRGYLIKRAGLYLGLTPSTVGDSFGTQQLTSAGTPASGTHNDWVTPTGGFAIGTGSELVGTSLVDTGLLNMIIEDSSLASSGTVASGTQITVYVGTHDYIITVGGTSGATPTSVSYANPSHGTFINTGLRALYHYDVLYDADAGLYGLWYIQ
ncbi:hypothetical protein ACFQBQ_06190 [Granulicella cerasi]|uniref:Uncharacterized protein n=1 Tax=Granulicella cerasi TaxID=741063 RepID=A0ABW1Z7X9_9BACT|nr:hypothetical protein [Granulicella cerasi]